MTKEEIAFEVAARLANKVCLRRQAMPEIFQVKFKDYFDQKLDFQRIPDNPTQIYIILTERVKFPICYTSLGPTPTDSD